MSQGMQRPPIFLLVGYLGVSAPGPDQEPRGKWGLLLEELAEGVVTILTPCDLNHLRNGVMLLDALA